MMSYHFHRLDREVLLLGFGFRFWAAAAGITVLSLALLKVYILIWFAALAATVILQGALRGRGRTLQGLLSRLSAFTGPVMTFTDRDHTLKQL